MKNEVSNPTLVKGVKELDRLANLWNKSKDETYREEWYRLIKKLSSLLPSV
jgi:hypothetical protein